MGKRIPNFYLNSLSKDQIKSPYTLDLVKDVPDKRDFKFSKSVFSEKRLNLPIKIDWTSKMSPVKNQGNLGSCVGFAVTAMKEFQEQVEHEKEVAEGKKYKREQDHYDLSEAWVYWNSKKIDPWPDQQGTSIRCAMQVLHKIGIPCERAYPYSDEYKGEPESWAKLIAKWGLIDSYWRCSNTDDLKLALIDGPVVIGIGCFREIFFPSETGNIPYPNNINECFGGHAVCAVGYNETSRKIKFKNSWGSQWGKGGYGFVSYRYIENFMWDAWAAKDLSVTRKILKERAKDNLV
jgi:C1A family cysteine protease